MVVSIIEKVYSFLWGDWIKIPLPGGGSLGISLLIILLIPTGIYFTIRTKFLQIRLFPDMVRALVAKKEHKDSLSTFQTLIVSTATRVGMGNLVGVVAAVSAGGAGAVFWMWITALIGSATAFIEATLAQLHKEKDPLYGGYRGGPAYYIHHFFEEKSGKKKKHVLVAVLFAISGLICWCGISGVNHPFSISQPSPVWRFPFYMAAPSDADIILHQRVFSYVLAVLIQISGKTFSVFGKFPVEILPIRFRCPRLEIGDGLCIPLVNSHTVFLSPAVAGHPAVNRVKRRLSVTQGREQVIFDILNHIQPCRILMLEQAHRGIARQNTVHLVVAVPPPEGQKPPSLPEPSCHIRYP